MLTIKKRGETRIVLMLLFAVSMFIGFTAGMFVERLIVQTDMEEQ